MRGTSQPGTISHPQLPRYVDNNTFNKPIQHSPATRVFSPGKPLTVKFNYQGKQGQTAQAINFQPPFQPQASPIRTQLQGQPQQKGQVQPTTQQYQQQQHQNHIVRSASAPN